MGLSRRVHPGDWVLWLRIFPLFLWCFYTQPTMIPLLSLTHTHTDWLVFHCCTGHSVSAAARTFGQWHSVCAGATLLTVQYSPHKMRTLCAKCHVRWLPRDHRRWAKTAVDRPRAEKKSLTIHRNSKWSCNSTCFDSSGRICAVCEPEPTTATAALSSFIPRSHSQIPVYVP